MQKSLKSDVVLMSLVNFLVPLILLYAFFSLMEYSENGFFAVIYSAILCVIAFMIYGLKFSHLHLSNLVSIRVIAWFALLISLIYITSILLFLIDAMPKLPRFLN
ncbi:MAG: hypothetical protein O3B09_01735 [Proteobacteria bacterium]|nr:hypothetical protein [Pseudomonadota bacterium]